jgi:hypothetical protein
MLKQSNEKVTIKRICARREFYVGRTITFEAIFHGWGTGGCEFPAEAESNSPNKSDWVISTEKDCAYVSGGLPDGVSPANKEDLGCHIELTAIVAVTDDGGIYFEFVSGRRIREKAEKTAA